MIRDRVMVVSLGLVAIFVGIGIFSLKTLREMSAYLYDLIVTHFGWAYLLAVSGFLVFIIIIAFSRFGGIKLGMDDERPEYSFFGWFSMLFAAGMGIGLIFYGVAEPLNHFARPPQHIQAETGEAAAFAMQYSFFHWGLHPWAVYALMGAAIAYFSFRRGMKPLISSCFYPLLGPGIYGPWGQLVDILAVFATIFGVVTSLGLGALQINSGLNHVYGLPETNASTVVIIAVITVLFMISSASGLDKGIQILSKTNIFIASVLLGFMLIAGPTSFILNVITSSVGRYANDLLKMSLEVNPFQGEMWTRDWTLFYWAWAVSWSPFVGFFIARISRGRTLKEFVLGVLLVPTMADIIWFGVFGGAGLHLELRRGIPVAQAAAADVSTALFQVLQHYPLGAFLSTLSVVLLLVFFVTSADSATFVLGMMTSKGSLNPPLLKKMLWGTVQSTVAVIVLFSGGLAALQQMAITAALPFTAVMVLLCWSLWSALAEEGKTFLPSAAKASREEA